MLNVGNISIDITNNESNISINEISIINKFYRILSKEEKHTLMIESEWLKHFKLVYGDIEKNLSTNKKIKYDKLIKKYKIESKNFKPHRMFFAIQSYYSMLIKLMTSKLVREHKKGYADIQNNIKDILIGDYFLKYGIDNYCYEDWFSWFIDSLDDELESLIEELDDHLESYKEDDYLSGLNSIQNNDYIKQIYEAVIPHELRHALGEYYTPDWLAEHTIDSVCNINDNKGNIIKMLDPTCGSGTFVFKAIQMVRNKNHNIGLKDIINTIKGFDINPLAVLTTKTNYLISILDKINELEFIEIPIYSYDVINTPKTIDNVIIIDIDDNIFKIPNKILENDNLDNFNVSLRLSLKEHLNTSEFIQQILTFTSLSVYEKELIIQFYNQINSYQNFNISMIWVNLIDNWLKAYIEEEFDIIIGNPPWVNWEYMPKDYRIKSQHMWPEIGIYSATGKERAFSKEDVSTLITYLCLDKFLKDKGHLAFVIRQGIFKSAQNGEGFRRFKIREDVEIKVNRVDDLSLVKPFENATNQTAVMYLQKGIKNEYPVPYIEWEKKRRKKLRSYATLDEILDIVKKKSFIAKPSIDGDITSLWITGDRKVLENIDSILGSNNYRARTGVFSGGANAVYWMDINEKIDNEIIKISNVTARAKRKVEDVVVNIENKYVYPLLRGSDVKVWDAEPSIYMLCPHTVKTKMKPVPVEEFSKEVPLTANYLKYFKKSLDERKGFAGWEKQNQKENFHSVLRVGEYTFSKYKIVWKYIASSFISAVISDVDDEFLGRKMVLPNEKIMYISTDNEDEAYYLCGVLSSKPVALCVQSFMNPTSISTHVLKKLNIDDFDANNSTHMKIASICKQGHLEIDVKKKEFLLSKIDNIIANIYGIEDEELDYILEQI